jgi:hypothetical protein
VGKKHSQLCPRASFFVHKRKKNSNTSTRGECNHKLHQELPCNSFLPTQGEFTPKNPNDNKLVKRQPKCDPILADTNPNCIVVKEEEEGEGFGNEGVHTQGIGLDFPEESCSSTLHNKKRTSKNKFFYK